MFRCGLRSHLARPYSELPGPKHYPVIGALPTFISRGGLKEVMKIQDHLYTEYGPICRYTIVGAENVFVSDPDAYRKVFMKEGKLPRGSAQVLWPFVKYYESRKRRSLAFSDGELWQKLRRPLQKRLLHPRHAEEYAENIHESVRVGVKALAAQGSNLPTFVSMWTAEMMAAILFCTSPQYFSGKATERDRRFIDDILMIFQDISTLAFGYPHHRWFETKRFRTFAEAMDRVTETGGQYVLQCLRDIEASRPGIEKAFLAHLLQGETVDTEDLITNVGGLYFAGVDTTSVSLLWQLYHLAKNPAQQQMAFEEVQTVCKGKLPVSSNLQDLVYLSAVMRETFRMSPTAGGITRKLSEDIELCGYTIPKETNISFTFAMARDPNVVAEPELFRPERWLEAGDPRHLPQPNPLAKHSMLHMQFGFGARMCLGARLANVEMKCVLSGILQEYKLELEDPQQVCKWDSSRLITRPDPSPRIKFIKRQ